MKNLLIMTAVMGLLGVIKGEVLPRRVEAPSTPYGRCGSDKSTSVFQYKGRAKIETYPWLGTLYYATDERVYSTPVVLVTKQIVIGTAMDIDRLPKLDIRANSRVILGRNCSTKGIRVRDYSYHPDFKNVTNSALAIVQLEVRYWMTDLTPICPPGERSGAMYALVQADDCKNSIITIHKMDYVDPAQCKMYYGRSELDIEKIWPTHTICAKALTGPECVWENGAVLVTRQESRWHLLGFGVLGPGCKAPSRFLDYAIFKPWVQSSVARIGLPTVTRLADNEVILRRSLSNVQRYGPCDPEEFKEELFTDRTVVHKNPSVKIQRATYNFTIFSNLEYSCIVFQSTELKGQKLPYIRLRRWCITHKDICYTSRYLQVDFAIEIYFYDSVEYKVMVYGREIRLFDRKKLMRHLNKKKPFVTIYKARNF